MRPSPSSSSNAVTASVPQPRRILAVFNPAAGGERRGRFVRVVDAIRKLGGVVTIVETTAPGDAERIARDTAAQDFDIIAAAGGDGTVNEIINGLRDRDIPLGLIPLGTANVLADEIGLGRDIDKVARALVSGAIKPIRVGRANGRRFTMMAGAGFDANVVDRVSLRLKKLIGPLAYVWQSAVQATTDRFESCDVTIDGTAYKTVSVVACNGRRYGGPFIAAPGASLSDDCFHILLMSGRGWLSVLRYGLGLMLGRLTTLHDVRLVTGRDMTVRGNTSQPVQADGDIVAHLPLTVTIDPVPVRLVHPA
ncbi:MAG: diacylglycerol kinase family lipid kinase [Rhodospirillaceae bacterium]|nr:diacylglycerol kinase family lipid kinase [Rhodospirillaceae bacterium]